MIKSDSIHRYPNYDLNHNIKPKFGPISSCAIRGNPVVFCRSICRLIHYSDEDVNAGLNSAEGFKSRLSDGPKRTGPAFGRTGTEPANHAERLQILDAKVYVERQVEKHGPWCVRLR